MTADFCKRIVTVGNWDLGVQDRYILQAWLWRGSQERKKVFLFYSLSSVLVIMFSLVSASSNIQGELPTSKRLPRIFRKNANSFFCTFEQERRPFKIGKFHLCSKRQYRDKKRAIYEGWGDFLQLLPLNRHCCHFLAMLAYLHKKVWTPRGVETIWNILIISWFIRSVTLEAEIIDHTSFFVCFFTS